MIITEKCFSNCAVSTFPTCTFLPRHSDIHNIDCVVLVHVCRRRKVGTALLKACEALAVQWRHRFMSLRAYEDDDGARGLYSKTGYRVVSRDPDWVTWIGRRRRVLMMKDIPVHDHEMELQ
jgi:GNAT superfamily N-acetyltransferase